MGIFYFSHFFKKGISFLVPLLKGNRFNWKDIYHMLHFEGKKAIVEAEKETNSIPSLAFLTKKEMSQYRPLNFKKAKFSRNLVQEKNVFCLFYFKGK